MNDDRYSPDKLIDSYPTAGGILEVFEGNWYRHTGKLPPTEKPKQQAEQLSFSDDDTGNGTGIDFEG